MIMRKWLPEQPKPHDHERPGALRVLAVTGSCPACYLAQRRTAGLLTAQVSAWLSSVLRIVVRYANSPDMCRSPSGGRSPNEAGRRRLHRLHGI